jgi:hypothetical protein
MTILAWIKSILPNWIIRVEFCQRCGIRQPLAWQCDSDEIWKEINGTTNGVLCPKCFDAIAKKKGIFIMWHAEGWFREDKK